MYKDELIASKRERFAEEVATYFPKQIRGFADGEQAKKDRKLAEAAAAQAKKDRERAEAAAAEAKKDRMAAEAMQRRALAALVDQMQLPSHWSGKELPLQGWRLEQLVFFGQCKASNEDLKTVFQNILAIADPNELGKGRDTLGYPRKYTKLELEHVWRIEDPFKWQSYMSSKETVRQQLLFQRRCLSCQPEPTKLDGICSLLPASLDLEVNEKFLLHGTKPQIVIDVLQHGLNEKYSTIGGLFGAGVYLAERPDKTDQYCVPDVPGISDASMAELHSRLYRKSTRSKEDVFYTFLCRAILGVSVYTQDGQKSMRPPYEDVFRTSERRMLVAIPGTMPSIPYHSLIGATGIKLRRFREFVVYEGARIFPEYLIAYKRV